MNWKNAKIIFFDGNCGLCNGTVRWIKNQKRSYVFEFTPLEQFQKINDSNFKIKLPENYDGIIFISRGSSYLKSNAIFRILFELHPFWKTLYPILWIPQPFRDFFYDLIAQNRHRFLKGKNHCKIEV
jgi:predicted DCC family thiol-disulfide oxidoreductase YuxK